jgi:CMP-N-acetylneuraminic acid synthetase
MKVQNKNKYIVVIPARGGSKTIKFKNTQTFNGIPLISFAVKKFKKLELNLEVIVTSDSDEILNLASKVGAFCIKRPIELSGDNATSESAITHAIKVYSEKNNNFNSIIFHQCTSPLISENSILKSISTYEINSENTVFSVIEENNPIWLFNSKLDEYEISNNKEEIRGPRQKRKPQLIETGGIYIFDRKKFEEIGNRFLGKPLPIVIPKKESVDIDDPEDLIFANNIK